MSIWVASPILALPSLRKPSEKSKKIGFEKGKGWAISRIALGNGNDELALNYHQKALLVFEKIQYKTEIAKNFIKLGLDNDVISKATSLTPTQIEKLRVEN